MMAVIKCTNTEIRFRDCPFQTLVVENKALLRRITYNFYTEDPDEFIAFSKNYTPFAFAQKGLYIPSPVHLDFSSKKLLVKINAHMEQTANVELHAELFRIKGELINFAQQLSEIADFQMEYSDDISAKDIIKLFEFGISRGDMDFTEAFVEHIRLLSRYLGVRLFVVSNLHAVFDSRELELIFETLLLSEVNILCLESACPVSISSYEQLQIIDNDLCEICGSD